MIRWFQSDFRLRIILLFAAISIISYSFSGLSIYQSVAQQFESELADNLTSSIEFIQGGIERQIEAGAAWDSLSAEPANSSMISLLVAEQDLLPSEFNFNPPISRPFVTQNGIATNEAGIRFIFATAPINVDAQASSSGANGLILLDSLEQIDSILATLYPRVIGALIGTLVAIAGAGLYMANNISRLLTEIEEVAEAIINGEYERRAQVQSKDAIGRLASTINRMAGKLAALSQAQSQFFSKVSHELRTPLTIVKGFTITMLRKGDLDESTQRSLNIINQQTDNLVHLVDDLIDFARMDVDQFVLSKVPTDLVRIVDDTVASYQAVAIQTQTHLRYQPAISTLTFSLDEQRIRQVLQILLDNAFKHTKVDDTIAIELESSGKRASITVIDNGIGIPEESIPHVFERFYQADTSTQGMGLGLALARELTEAHNGTISVANNLDGGCRFCIKLPILESV